MFDRRKQTYNMQSSRQVDSELEESFCQEKIYIHKNLQCEDFSFKLNQSQQQISKKPAYSFYKSQTTFSLKQNLQLLEKSEIIEILLEQISSNNGNKIKQPKKDISYSQNYLCLDDTFGGKKSKHNSELVKYKTQYEDLVKGFQEYIENTRQAQEHYLKTIEELKRQNKLLSQQLSSKSLSSSNMGHSNSPRLSSHTVSIERSCTIQKLEQKVQNYIKINSQLLNRVDRLQKCNKQYSEVNERLKKQLKELQEDYQKLDEDFRKLENENELIGIDNGRLIEQNANYKTVIQELRDYIVQRREVKAQIASNDHSQRSIKSEVSEQTLNNHKNLVLAPNQTDDSIIQSSEIRRQQNSMTDSTIMFEKQQMAKQSRQQQIYNRASTEQQNTATFRMIQLQNNELKITNTKLQQLLQKKSQRITLMMKEIDCLTDEKRLLNEEIIDLKCRLKRIEDKDNTFGQDESISQFCEQSKARVGSIKSNKSHEQDYDSLDNCCSSLGVQQVTKINSPINQKKNSNCTGFSKLKSDQSYNKFGGENLYEKKINDRLQRLLAEVNKKQAFQKEVSQQESGIHDKESFQMEENYVPKVLLSSNKKF